jgi:AraC-like DNA-binding protein
MKRSGRDIVRNWSRPYAAVERYVCTTTARRVSERHSHETYQLGLSSTNKASYGYRGAAHRVGPGTLSIIHAGEVHETYEHEIIPEPVVYEIAYVPSLVLRGLASDLAGRDVAAPFFPPVLDDGCVVALFRQFHDALHLDGRLEADSAFTDACTHLIARFCDSRPPGRHFTPSHAAVRRSAEYLHERYADNVSLRELAQVAGLSVSHFCSAFRREYGLPPHQFRLQIRISRAKELISRGMPAAEVAIATGFSHQSHFGRHFKRLLGVSPASFAPVKR